MDVYNVANFLSQKSLVGAVWAETGHTDAINFPRIYCVCLPCHSRDFQNAMYVES